MKKNGSLGNNQIRCIGVRTTQFYGFSQYAVTLQYEEGVVFNQDTTYNIYIVSL
jgi:hypothetical protein